MVQSVVFNFKYDASGLSASGNISDANGNTGTINYSDGKTSFGFSHDQLNGDGSVSQAKISFEAINGLSGGINLKDQNGSIGVTAGGNEVGVDFSGFNNASAWNFSANTDGTIGGSATLKDGNDTYSYSAGTTANSLTIEHLGPDGTKQEYSIDSEGISAELSSGSGDSLGKFDFKLNTDNTFKFSGSYKDEEGSSGGDAPWLDLSPIINFMFPLAHGAEFTDSEKQHFVDQFNTAEITRSPLVLDLDGDGVETIGASQGIYFDHDKSGFSENTGWVGKDDGLLVWDKNKNGKIDDGTELFGNNTDLRSGQSAQNGFLALADLDDNLDGKFDSRDKAYAELGVWIDKNSDGVLQQAEYLTLAQANVKSIDLSYSDKNQSNTTLPYASDANNNQHRQTGSFTKTDGTTHAIEDVWFDVNSTDTIDNNLINISPTIASLPDIAAFGDVHSLHQAIARDSTGALQTLIESFTTEADPDVRRSLLTNIIYLWAGVASSDPHSRDNSLYGNAMGDSRKLLALEKFMGDGFIGTWCWGEKDPNPNGPAAALLLQSFDELSGLIYSKLMMQTHLKDIFTDLTLTISGDGAEWNVSSAVNYLKDEYAQNSKNGIALAQEFSKYLANAGAIGSEISAEMRKYGNDTGSAIEIALLNFGFASFPVGTVNSDMLIGTASRDLILGYAGDDHLYGGAGDDYLSGGAGSDYMMGGDGSDTYVFNKGDGNDFIFNADSDAKGTRPDILLFGEGILPQDILARRSGYDLQFFITSGEVTESIVIQSYFDNSLTNNGYALDQIIFKNGTIWLQEDILNLLTHGTPGADVLQGTDNENYLDGGAGYDQIYGGASNDILVGGDDGDLLKGNGGNDTLIGGSGADTLIGNSGNNIFDGGLDNDSYESLGGGSDTYIMRKGDGNDVASGLANEIIILVENKLIDSLSFTKLNSSLIITIDKDPLNKLEIQGFFSELGANKGITLKDFSGASQYLAPSELNAKVVVGSAQNETIEGFYSDDTINGRQGNDIISGYLGNDTLEGGEGSDQLSGGGGNDTYVFGRGDGQDKIDNYDKSGAVNTLRFVNAASSDIVVFRNEFDLVFRLKGTYDQVSFYYYYAEYDSVNGVAYDAKIDVVEFLDGTKWFEADIENAVQLGADNSSPTFIASPPKLRAVIGEAFSYTIPKDLIIDPNVGDTVFYSVEGFNGEALPAWLNFNRDTRTLSGTPSAGDQGIPRLFLWGRDNYGAGTAYDLVLNVTGPNHNPTLNAQISDQSLAEGLAFTYSIPSNTFSDSDAGDSLTLTATLEDGSPLPSWLTYNPTNNTFSGIPPAGAVGATTVLITARDTMGAAATDIFKFITTIQNLTINGTSSNDTLSGRSGNDTINGGNGNDLLYGRDGNDRLDGGSGNDTMFGGAGNDVYVVNSALDVLNENANEGSDTAESSITYTLSSNIENLILTGTSAINGTGNTLANTLTGNSAINTLTGAAGNDTLDGKGGADKLIGGTGDDVYIVDNVGDVITELLNEGIDSVQSSVTYTLATNAENLTLLGTTAINGTGNSLNNFLQGNSAANTLMGGAGNDRLDGLAGSDKLVGGAGDDTYVIDSTGDTVTENANEGIDTVETSITYTLGSNLENITLSGSNAINATGNSLNNTITGNQGNNILSGGAGNDVLIGNAGSDTLNGGTGNDTYQLSRGFGSDTLVDSDATSGNLDSVYFMNDIMSDQLWFSKAAGSNDLKIAVIGTSDNFLIKDWYVSSANHVEQLKSADGKTLTDSNVQNLVNAMASFSPPAQGETTLSASYHTALDATIAANWK